MFALRTQTGVAIIGKTNLAVLYFGVFSFLSWKSNLATPAAYYEWRCLNLTQ